MLSIDEKTGIQALDRTQPLLPITFGVTEKRTHDYVRHGTTNLFAALNVTTGEVWGAPLFSDHDPIGSGPEGDVRNGKEVPQVQSRVSGRGRAFW